MQHNTVVAGLCCSSSCYYNAAHRRCDGVMWPATYSGCLTATAFCPAPITLTIHNRKKKQNKTVPSVLWANSAEALPGYSMLPKINKKNNTKSQTPPWGGGVSASNGKKKALEGKKQESGRRRCIIEEAAPLLWRCSAAGRGEDIHTDKTY